MTIYFILIFSWILTYNILNKKNMRNYFLIIGILSLFILMGFRSWKIGTDTYYYCIEYLNRKYVSWKSIDEITRSLGNMNYGFDLLNNTVSLFAPNSYTIYLMVISGIISFSLYSFIVKFSTNYLMSLIIILCLGFIFFFMSGIKQTLAISFVLISYIKLRDKKYFQFLLLIFLASTFHNTAIIILILLIRNRVKNGKFYYYILPMIIAFSLIFQKRVVSYIFRIFMSGKYAMYFFDKSVTLNMTGLYIQCVIMLIVFILVGYRIKKDKELQFYTFIYSVGIFFQTLTPVIAEFFRISMYFSIVSCVMLPYAVSKSKYKQKKLISGVIISFFIFYFYVANIDNNALVPYEFFFH